MSEKGHREQDDEGLRYRTRIHVEQHENDRERERHDEFQTFLGLFQVLELSAPLHRVTRRQMSGFRDALRGGAHIAVDITGRYVDEDKAHKLPVLAANTGRPGLVIDVGQKFDGHLRPAWRWNEDALDRAKVLPEIARVSRIDRITLAPFDRGCDGLAADGRFNDVVHVLNR